MRAALTVGRDRGDLMTVVGGGACALAVGGLVARAPVLAGLPVAGLAALVAIVRFGRIGLVVPPLMLLPWMVVFDDFIPPLLRTFTTAAAAAALLIAVSPLRFHTRLVPIGATVFLAVIAVHVLAAETGEQLVQAAKYVILPAVALAAGSVGAADVLPRLKTPLLGSSVAALGVHMALVTAGLGSTGSYYDAGEKLGFAGVIPHELALLGVIVAAAGLTTERTWTQIGCFAMGAVPAVLTGVRSALLAAALILLLFMVEQRVRPRTVTIVAGIFAIGFLTGAFETVTARFAAEADELGSLSSAGSGRGSIWTVALSGWGDGGPLAWLFGSGLRSVAEFEVLELGQAFVGHSDVIEALVQLGLVGFAAYVAIWAGLLGSRLRSLVLVPLLVYAAVNGAIEYVAPLAIGITLAAACRRPSDKAPAAVP